LRGGYPGTCDIATVYVTITDCDATADENNISGKVFIEQLPDDGTFDNEIFVTGIQVDLYGDANCNGVIDAGETIEKSTVSDLSGVYQFSTINGYYAKDDFDPTATYAGNDGSVNWTTNWAEQSDDGVINTGDVRIINDPEVDNNAIRLGGPNNGISRSLTFSEATGATLNLVIEDKT